ncbi:MAG: hypothetical protein AB7I25_04000, partial [Vicinamibacterales bacterium]
FVTEGLKRFEYALRRQTEDKDKEVVLSATDEVPDAFRAQVEQYYRSLSKGGASEKSGASGAASTGAK